MQKKINRFLLPLLIVVGLIALFECFSPGLPLTHDGQDHVARIANFCQSLAEGNIVPRWAANLNWGYGHPILMFLYPLPSYLACFWRFLGFSFVDSTKIVFGLSLLLSGIFMFLWLKEIWDDEAALAGGLLYMLAPYRLVDLYVRAAIGECWAFVWPPLIAWFILKLSQQFNWRYFVGGSLSIAALILSHNALSLMFLPVIVGYMIYLGFKRGGILIFFGLAIAAFFWLPAFFEGKYTLRDIVTQGNITGFEPLTRMIWSPWNYRGTGSFSVQLGVWQWLGVLVAPFLIWLFWRKKSKKTCLFLLFLYLIFWLAILMILPISRPVYLAVPLLQKFQFAWRWLSLAIFPPAIFIAAAIYLLPKKWKLLAVSFLLFTILVLGQSYWHAKSFLHHPESFYTGPYPGTTDTGESAPRWSVRFMEHFPDAAMQAIEGEAEIFSQARKTNLHTYHVQAATAARLLENTLYFPGWQVLVDGQPAAIQFQDPAYRGLMTFSVPAGDHQVVVRFGETKLRRFANLISLASLFMLAASAIVLKFKRC